MKKIICCIILISTSYCLKGQAFNLVPNPSFEDYILCPFSYGQIVRALNWSNPLQGSTPDYLNSCNTSPSPSVSVPLNRFGYENAHSGVAYAAIVTYSYNYITQLPTFYREYLQTQLNDSLVAGVEYCIRFYVSACDSERYVSNDIGMYFSQTEIKDTCKNAKCILQLSPQFENPLTNNLNSRNGWTLVSGSYTAMGGEKFIIIGNFKDTANTTAIFTGWSANYYIFNWAQYYIDDVLIAPCDSLTGIEENQLNNLYTVFPTIANSLINIKHGNESIERWMIFNSIGQLILMKTELSQKGVTSINISNLSSGIYFIKVITHKKQYNFKFIKN